MTDEQKHLWQVYGVGCGLLGIGLLKTGMYFYEKRRMEKEIAQQKKTVADLDRFMASVREDMRKRVAEKIGSLPNEPIT